MLPFSRKVKDLSGSFRLGKSSGSASKGNGSCHSGSCVFLWHTVHHFMCFTDVSLRTSHFTMTTQTTPFMPILIRSDKSLTSVLDRPNATLDHRTTGMDSKKSVMEHSNSGFYSKDHRTSTLDHREHRSSTLEQRSKTMERSCGPKDSRSRKLLT